MSDSPGKADLFCPPGNLFKDLPSAADEEQFESLLRNENVHIERIVSAGQTSEEGHWYDQEWGEWVMVLRGAARLAFADGEEVSVGPGDYLYIPAHVRHRVVWTDPGQETLWLAVHCRPGQRIE